MVIAAALQGGFALVFLPIILVALIVGGLVVAAAMRRAASRNPNRAENEEDRARQERESGEQGR